MDTLDFTAYPPGTQYEGQALATCPICGKVGLPGRRRREETLIHKGVLMRGALAVTAFCAVSARARLHER